MIEFKTFVFNPFAVNTYVIYNSGADGYIIDAACSDENELKQLIEFTEKESIQVKGLINTHCHVDHILGVEYLRKYFNTEFLCAQEEQFLIDSSVAQGQFFGLKVNKPSNPDRYISEDDILNLNDSKIQIFQVPGHSPGSLVFYLGDEKKLFCGDVLFSGSIGRTDLPGGDFKTLVDGIKNKLMVLDDDVMVYPGHGPSTTIGDENFLNPFLQ
ncbi:MAG: MBL fold metallo-hydrolase [Bacteroidota bacterium]